MYFMRVFLICALVIVSMHRAVANNSVDSALSTLLGADIYNGKSSSSPSRSGSNSGVYRVKRGDTLDGIIRKNFNNSKVRKPIIRQAFVKANPKVFRRGNPNWMYAGRVLTMPEIKDFQKAIFVDGTPAATSKRNWVTYP